MGSSVLWLAAHSCNKESDVEEHGIYALFVMLLFRPWRGQQVPDFLERALCHGSGMPITVAWQRLATEYRRWRRDEIDAVAQPYLDRASPVDRQPPFDSREWWACMTALRLRNLDISLRQGPVDAPGAVPSDLSLLPVIDVANLPQEPEAVRAHSDPGSDSNDTALQSGVAGKLFGDDADEPPADKKPRRSFPDVLLASMFAGHLPEGVQLHDLVSWPQGHRQGKRVGVQEGCLTAYAQSLQRAVVANTQAPVLASTHDDDFPVSAADAVAAHGSQVKFLRNVDAYAADTPTQAVPARPSSTAQPSSASQWAARLEGFISGLPAFPLPRRS